MHISSANSRKSATRPAFSSAWLRVSFSPSTRTFFQNSSRMAGISASAFVSDCSVRDIPQLSQSTWPRRRWISSTVFLPLIDSSLPHLVLDALLGLLERGVVDRHRLRAEQRCEVVADRVRENEVTVGEPLHERGRPEAVRAVVGEVRLAEHEQPGEVAHQVVVDPEPAHRVVDRGVDAHRHAVRVFAGDLRRTSRRGSRSAPR